ncbi:hypothetical protein [Methylocystis hirsuta]|uniref:Uncharacterized protein n=1 Tax=Methylocystis hirsuta TaxID=369798 RepID=A0A3M9XRK5_9HYPH|nr:hypothetical protein [Methylocystis hirsuta]RNJ50286.1 hypothetical protein D1O30_12440 [Methylocystis hirsuta]
MMAIEEAARDGACAGLLGAGVPRGMERLSGAAKAEFAEGYATGRHCRRVAEGKEHVRAAAPVIPDHAMTREQLVAEFRRRPDLRREFLSEAGFVAFAMAQRAGKVSVVRKRAVL